MYLRKSHDPPPPLPNLELSVVEGKTTQLLSLYLPYPPPSGKCFNPLNFWHSKERWAPLSHDSEVCELLVLTASRGWSYHWAQTPAFYQHSLMLQFQLLHKGYRRWIWYFILYSTHCNQSLYCPHTCWLEVSYISINLSGRDHYSFYHIGWFCMTHWEKQMYDPLLSSMWDNTRRYQTFVSP